MANTWLEALKQYNATQPKYTVPKKGTPNYFLVKEIQRGLDSKKKKVGGAGTYNRPSGDEVFNKSMYGKVYNSTPYKLITASPITGAQSLIEAVTTQIAPTIVDAIKGNGKKRSYKRRK